MKISLSIFCTLTTAFVIVLNPRNVLCMQIAQASHDTAEDNTTTEVSMENGRNSIEDIVVSSNKGNKKVADDDRILQQTTANREKFSNVSLVIPLPVDDSLAEKDNVTPDIQERPTIIITPFWHRKKRHIAYLNGDTFERSIGNFIGPSADIVLNSKFPNKITLMETQIPKTTGHEIGKRDTEITAGSNQKIASEGEPSGEATKRAGYRGQRYNGYYGFNGGNSGGLGGFYPMKRYSQGNRGGYFPYPSSGGYGGNFVSFKKRNNDYFSGDDDIRDLMKRRGSSYRRQNDPYSAGWGHYMHYKRFNNADPYGGGWGYSAFNKRGEESIDKRRYNRYQDPYSNGYGFFQKRYYRPRDPYGSGWGHFTDYGKRSIDYGENTDYDTDPLADGSSYFDGNIDQLTDESNKQITRVNP